MPKFTSDFTAEEISCLIADMEALRSEAERRGMEKELAILDSVCEKLGNWS